MVPEYLRISSVPLPRGKLLTYNLIGDEVVVSAATLIAGLLAYWPAESLTRIVPPPAKVKAARVNGRPVLFLG